MTRPKKQFAATFEASASTGYSEFQSLLKAMLRRGGMRCIHMAEITRDPRVDTPDNPQSRRARVQARVGGDSNL